jgi:hypothetical protein
VGAEGANFGIVVKLKPFASHRNQFAGAGANAVVRAHFARPAAEKAGKRERGESGHLLCVRAGEWNMANRGTWRTKIGGKHHRGRRCQKVQGNVLGAGHNIVALHTFECRHSHLAKKIWILAESFLSAAPAWVA